GSWASRAPGRGVRPRRGAAGAARRRDDRVEEAAQERRVGAVAQRALRPAPRREQREVGVVVLVELQDPLDQRRVAREVAPVEEAAGVEVAGDRRIAPVDRDALAEQRVGQLLARVPDRGLVLEGNGELALPVYA